MTGRCKTCRWWDRSQKPGYDDVADWGYCDLAESGISHMQDEDRRKHQETLAIARDASGYNAWLVTSPEFGCVQWEAKP